MKLTLKSQKGRRQVWDLDGTEVNSLAGEGHLEAHSKDPRAAEVVKDFIRGAYPEVTDYPRVGESVEIPDGGPEDEGPPSSAGPPYDTLEEKKGLK